MANDGQRAFWSRANMEAVWPHLEQVSDHGTAPLLEAAELTSPERVIDVGCGGGKQTMALARAVAPGGSVLGLDISPQMISLARRRMEEADIRNVTLKVSDVQIEPFERASFDVAVSQFGCMFFEAPEIAFANLCGALKSGGRMACVVWQSAERMAWMPNRLLQPFMPDAESPINPHALADPDYVQALLTTAGFERISLEERNIEARVADDFIQDAFSVDLVPEEHKAEARELVAAHKEQFRKGDGYLIELPMLIIQAHKPGG